MNACARGLVLLLSLGAAGWAYMALDAGEPAPAPSPTFSQQGLTPSASAIPEAAVAFETPTATPPAEAAPSPAPDSIEALARHPIFEDPSRDLPAALQASFALYDAQLAQPGTMPAWWGNRNIHADISAMDPMASITGIHCIQTMCGVDVHYQEAPPEREVFDPKLLNQPSLQGGALIKRFDGDPKRMRIYVFEAEMEPQVTVARSGPIPSNPSIPVQ